MAKEKEYTGTFTLGATTPTYDLESEPENFKPSNILPKMRYKLPLTIYWCNTASATRAFSNKNRMGKECMNWRGRERTVKIEPRTVTINEFEINKD